VLADPEGNEFCVLRLTAAEARAELGAGTGAQPGTPST
jgi:hypothetical protein